MNNLPIRVASLLSLFIMVSVACGQKPGVHLTTGGKVLAEGQSEGSVEGVIDPETGQLINPETGEIIDPQTGQVIGTSAGGITTTRSTAKKGGNTSANTATKVPTVSSTDKNGITSTEILIGFHAPLTGAAAVPLTDIQVGTSMYSNWLSHPSRNVRIHGRKVRTIFRDDQYSPSHATEVCREMVERQKVFLLVGGAGTDQIVACARYAATKGVPYLSAGVTERKLNTLSNYFAFSTTYPGQARMLAEMVYKTGDSMPGGKVWKDRCPPGSTTPAGVYNCNATGTNPPKIAVVYSNTDGFYDARDKFAEEWKAVSGKDVDKAYAITKFNMSTGDANTLISGTAAGNEGLKVLGFDVVYILTAPTNWLTILRVAEAQGYAPRWVGVGLTKGINTVAKVACEQSQASYSNSLFFNIWMSVDTTEPPGPTAYTDQFKAAWNDSRDNEAQDPYTDHDIAFGLWGGSVVQHALYEAAGADISRSKLISTIQNLKNVGSPKAEVPGFGKVTQIYSTLNYSPNDHFGADQAHLLFGDCSFNPGRWSDVPGKQFVSAGSF